MSMQIKINILSYHIIYYYILSYPINEIILTVRFVFDWSLIFHKYELSAMRDRGGNGEREAEWVVLE